MLLYETESNDVKDFVYPLNFKDIVTTQSIKSDLVGSLSKF